MPPIADRKQARALLAQHYPVTFPDDFYSLWEFCLAEAPKNPVYALGEGISLSGPFTLLAAPERIPTNPKIPILMHWRFYLDPPEFFSVLHGDVDGLHWGYWFDAPGELPPAVCSYYNNDAYELVPRGTSLREAIDIHHDGDVESLEENIEYDPDEKESYEEEIARIAALRERLDAWAWPAVPANRPQAVIETFGGMGLIVPKQQSNDLLHPRKLDDRADAGDPSLLPQAREALAKGRLGLALQIARAVWIMNGSKGVHSEAALILADVYEALGRPALAAVARVQAKHRGITSVDLLETANRSRVGGL